MMISHTNLNRPQEKMCAVVPIARWPYKGQCAMDIALLLLCYGRTDEWKNRTDHDLFNLDNIFAVMRYCARAVWYRSHG